MSIAQKHIEKLQQVAREYKEMLVARFGVGTDIQPQLDVVFVNERRFIGGPTQEFWEMAEMGIPIFELIGGAVRMLWDRVDRPKIEVIQMIIEGYVQAGIEPDYQHGDMERNYAEHADSKVSEQVGLYVATREGMTMISMPYVYTDGGVVRWAEPFVLPPDETMEGNIVEMFRHLFEDCNG